MSTLKYNLNFKKNKVSVAVKIANFKINPLASCVPLDKLFPYFPYKYAPLSNRYNNATPFSMLF